MAHLLTPQGAATAFCRPGCQALTTHDPATGRPPPPSQRSEAPLCWSISPIHHARWHVLTRHQTCQQHNNPDARRPAASPVHHTGSCQALHTVGLARTASCCPGTGPITILVSPGWVCISGLEGGSPDGRCGSSVVKRGELGRAGVAAAMSTIGGPCRAGVVAGGGGRLVLGTRIGMGDGSDADGDSKQDHHDDHREDHRGSSPGRLGAVKSGR